MPDGGADLREELTPVGPQYRVTLSFRDAAEIRWQVDEDGNLKEAGQLRNHHNGTGGKSYR
jgi:hypothetical protein